MLTKDSVPTVEELARDNSQHQVNEYQDIWNKWSGRRSAKITILLDMGSCWTLLSIDIQVWKMLVSLFVLYIPLVSLIVLVPWNFTMYRWKYCLDYQLIVKRFDDSLTEYMSNRSPLNRYTILRSYRLYSLLIVFIRMMWFVHYYDSLVIDSTLPLLAFIWYSIVILLPLIQSVFIWQFCNNVAKNYMERGLSSGMTS